LEVEQQEGDQHGWPAVLDLGPASMLKGYAHEMSNFLNSIYNNKFITSVLYVS
jgi:hypothetical protein